MVNIPPIDGDLGDGLLLFMMIEMVVSINGGFPNRWMVCNGKAY